MSAGEQKQAAAEAQTTAAQGSLLDAAITATKQTERSRAEELIRTLTEEALKGTVTFNKDVLPILQRRCQVCHRPGEIGPMPLTTYQGTRPWARAIKAAVVGKVMPPWFADPRYGHFANDKRLTDEEITAFTILLASAGNETVTKLLAAAVYWLWRYPDQRRLLVEEPRRIANAVEETLRFDPPSHYQGRTLTREVELHGVVMPKHAKVALVTGATGRDERRFPDPDRYDLRRAVGQHLAFGFGQHSCRCCVGRFFYRCTWQGAVYYFSSCIPFAGRDCVY